MAGPLTRQAEAAPARPRLGSWLAVMAMLMSAAVHAQHIAGVEAGRRLVVSRGGEGATVKEFTTTDGRPAQARTTARVRWDDQALSFVFECEDDEIAAQDRQRDDVETWQDDCVEIFLDLDHTHDTASRWIHVLVTAAGVVADERGPALSYRSGTDDMEAGDGQEDLAGLQTRVTRTDTGWRAEMVLPWKDLGHGLPKVGDVWGLNLTRSDYPASEWSSWSPTQGPFHRIHRWGHLLFADADGRADDAETKLDAGHHRLLVGDELLENLKMFRTRDPKPGQTWVELDGKTYGAQPDERGPIGGGAGYTGIVTTGDYIVSTLEELLDALGKAEDGEVVFIPGNVEIDCTVRVHIEQLVLEVPAGVTLASNRGEAGSKGAIILSETHATRPLIRVAGPRARITGLRLRGPEPNTRLDHHRRSFAEGRGHEYYYKFPISDGIQAEHPRLEVDNCELAGWSHGAIYLQSGKDHHIHHNFIHHNQYQGLGYGVVLDTATALIERNLFNDNRHSIAGTGRHGSGYEARHNVELGRSLSHCFDMHGGVDRQDGTDIAGARIDIHHNTFRPSQFAVVIRGVPEEAATIHSNWFSQRTAGAAVRHEAGTQVQDNAYGLKQPEVLDRPVDVPDR